MSLRDFTNKKDYQIFNKSILFCQGKFYPHNYSFWYILEQQRFKSMADFVYI